MRIKPPGVKRGQSIFPLLNSEDWLRKKYVEEGLSSVEIAKLVGSSTCSNVISALERFGIPRRERHERSYEIKRKYPIGTKFGSLTVVGYSREKDEQKSKYLCKCVCGKTIEVLNISQGQRSCGCLTKIRRNSGLYFRIPKKVLEEIGS